MEGGSLLRELCAFFGPGKRSIILGEGILREMEFKIFEIFLYIKNKL